MHRATILPLSVLFTTAVAVAQSGSELNAGSDRAQGSFQEDGRVEMEAFVVSANRVGGRPWRYVSIPGFEILSHCADYQTKDYIRAIMRGSTLEKMMLPDGCLASLAFPTSVILYDSGSSSNNSMSPLAPSSVTYGGPDSDIYWGDGRMSFRWPWATYDVDTVVDCVRLSADGFDFSGDDNPIPVWVHKTFAFRLRHRVPQFPPWLFEGLIGPDGVYGRGTEVRYDAHQMPVGMIVPAARWISDSETLSVKKQVVAVIPLPMKDLFNPGDLEQRSPSSIWLSEAALFVRWGMFYTPPKNIRQTALPEPDHRAAFWKLVDQATTGPVTDAMFRKCFGFGFDALKFKLERYLPIAAGELIGTRFSGEWDPSVPEPRDATEVETARIVGDWERIKASAFKTKDPGLSDLYLAEAGRMLSKPYIKGSRDPQLLGVLGLYEHVVGDDAKALEHLEAAAVGNVDRPSVYQTLAELRYHELESHPERSGGRLSAAQEKAVLDPLLDARARPPAMPETYRFIADVWSHSADKPALGELAVLDEGTKLFWTDAALADSVAKLRLQWGYGAKAQAEP